MEDENDQDDDEEMEEDIEHEDALKALDDRLNLSKYDYDAHISKVKLLRTAGELDELRIARNDFAIIFPLAHNLWLEWLQDEQNLAGTEEEKNEIYKLFDRAVEDYLSIDLWLEYCQFSLGGIATEKGIENARNVCERAVNAVGIHVARGSLIWEVFREFENAILSIFKDTEKEQEQRNRIDRLFRRQLALPLLDMDRTYSEYKSWLGVEEIDRTTASLYQKASEMLKGKENFESQLMALDEQESELKDEERDFEQRLSIYSNYLEHEFKQSGDPARIQNLYERRVTDLCLHPHVWTTYIDYIDHTLSVESVSLKVCKRAIRNISHSAAIWIRYLRALERYKKSNEIVLSTVEKAISCNLLEGLSKYREIWLTYIDYKRRDMCQDDSEEMAQKKREEIRRVFQQASDHLAGINGDQDYKVLKYWASVEAGRFHSMDEARKIWSNIMQDYGDRAEYWLEYINLEKTYGDDKHIRRLFIRALERTHDNPEQITRAWSQFEREKGSLEQFEECERKIKTRMASVIHIKSEENSKNVRAKQKDSKNDSFKGGMKLQDRKDKSRKRQHHPADQEKISSQSEPVFKKPTLPSNGSPSKTGSSNIMQKSKSPNTGKIVPPPGFQQIPPPPGYKGASSNSNVKDGSNVNPDMSSVDKSVVFLSNVQFAVTEQQIRDFFQPCGTIEEVRVIMDQMGKSKGFAYVKFSTVEEAQRALKKDREVFGGRPVFVSENDPNKKLRGEGHQLKFKTGLEKNKLFVKDLPKASTKQEVEALFRPFGGLKEVRLVTYRNGHSKGIAFVEFESEVGASIALLKTDGMNVGNNQISVALSNPPERKDIQPQKELISSLGSISKDNLGGYRGKGRSQVAFVPRAVQKNADKKDDVKGNVLKSTETIKDTKSNADFRNMLLGNK